MKARTNGEIASDLVPDEQVRQKTAGQKIERLQSLSAALVDKITSAIRVLNEIDGLSVLADDEMGGDINTYYSHGDYSGVMTRLDSGLRECMAQAKDLQEGLS